MVNQEVLTPTPRRKILEELIKNGEASPYEISKKVGISDSSVSRHLDILSDSDLIEPPETDVSGGRLKKIYKSTPDAEKAIANFWKEEIQSAPKFIREKYLKGE